MAERQRFELWNGLPRQRLSRSLQNYSSTIYLLRLALAKPVSRVLFVHRYGQPTEFRRNARYPRKQRLGALQHRDQEPTFKFCVHHAPSKRAANSNASTGPSGLGAAVEDAVLPLRRQSVPFMHSTQQRLGDLADGGRLRFHRPARVRRLGRALCGGRRGE